MTIKVLLIIIIGFASGLAVGSGFVAFLAVLGIIPRLTQLTKTSKYIHLYELGVVMGAVMGGWFSLRDSIFILPKLLLVPIGLASGLFVGMLAAALTEVLNVLPILAKRIGIEDKIVILVMAIVFGKIAGSLFHWIYYVDL
ncbi:stage V sporulation protein AB [Cytobacillus sp. S13-E01]|uniref:stage V sporulation protein AB n=1 Tax=Cytobacillus sp. S13-E01 TaxID=3031326 RepID=UPI0023D7F02F|nr:stage V sporulation protein AB [Cytobacillus sp. S13-E01]MDF0726146.1 stage V sporulation protein AB [Cytobacillus sp. S13-E01]